MNDVRVHYNLKEMERIIAERERELTEVYAEWRELRDTLSNAISLLLDLGFQFRFPDHPIWARWEKIRTAQMERVNAGLADRGTVAPAAKETRPCA